MPPFFSSLPRLPSLPFLPRMNPLAPALGNLPRLPGPPFVLPPPPAPMPVPPLPAPPGLMPVPLPVPFLNREQVQTQLRTHMGDLAGALNLREAIQTAQDQGLLLTPPTFPEFPRPPGDSQAWGPPTLGGLPGQIQSMFQDFNS